MFKSIKEKLKSIWIDWDYDKYWLSRDALFDKNANPIKFFLCKAYVSRQNRKQCSDIAYNISEGNNFRGHPILGHKLNGIVIAAGAQISVNCYISHQVTMGEAVWGSDNW